jgi:hypothetical protein
VGTLFSLYTILCTEMSNINFDTFKAINLSFFHSLEVLSEL